MAQVSRPFQIALAAMVLLAGVWFIALHRPGSGSSSSSGSSPAGPSSSSSSGAPGASTPVYHGAAPGVEGLTRAIDKAHGAVATSEQNAQQLQQKSAHASEPGASGAAVPSTTGAAQAGATSATSNHAGTAAGVTATTVHHAGTKTYTTTVHTTAKSKPGPVSANAVSNAQAVVLQSELGHGQTVLLLFWNPKSSDDVSVRKEAQAVAAHSKGKVVLHVALPAQVGQYGSVTRGVQVLQTPTLLLVDKRGLAVTMTGLMDQYAIQQGILEAKHAK